MSETIGNAEKPNTCPFCGGDNLEVGPVVYYYYFPGKTSMIRCNGCGATGPLAKTEKKAWKKFRKRKTIKVGVERVGDELGQILDNEPIKDDGEK